jgi:hypothetical protein
VRRLDRGWAKLVVHTAHRGNMRYTVNLLDAADEVAAGIAWLESLAPSVVEPWTP